MDDSPAAHSRPPPGGAGRPPYGYLAERVSHPVPAKRFQGATKSRLRLDPVRAGGRPDLRLAVVCVHCDRRMRGRTIHQRRYTYYTCRPAEPTGPRPEAVARPPKSIAVREDYLLDGILDFFARSVFHPERHQRLADQLATADVHSLRASERQRAALQGSIDDLDARARRLVRALELNTALDDDRGAGAAFAEVRERLVELQRQREAAERDLSALDDQQQPADTGAVELLDTLPAGTIALQGAPEPTLRRLFVAFQPQVRYDRHANRATLRVTLQEDRLDELLAVAGAITDPHQPPAHGDGTDDSPPFAHALPVPGVTTIGKRSRTSDSDA